MGFCEDGEAIICSPSVRKIMIPGYYHPPPGELKRKHYAHLDLRGLKDIHHVLVASACLRGVHKVHRDRDF